VVALAEGEALSPFGSEADSLREIARFIVVREY